MAHYTLFLALFSIGLAVCRANHNCPQNVKDGLDNSYLKTLNDKCYYFAVGDEKIYQDASDTCASFGGTLALPKTEAINAFLVHELRNTFGSNNAVWIGINDIDNEGEYVWVDGSVPEFTKFAITVGGFGGGAEDCIALQPKNSYWHDYECHDDGWWIDITDAAEAYVCEFQGVDGASATEPVPPETEAPPTTEALPETEAPPTTEALPETEAPPASEDVPPETDAPPTTEEVPSETDAPPATEEVPSETDAPPATEEVPPETDAPPTTEEVPPENEAPFETDTPPSTDATPATDAPPEEEPAEDPVTSD